MADNNYDDDDDWDEYDDDDYEEVDGDDNDEGDSNSDDYDDDEDDDDDDFRPFEQDDDSGFQPFDDSGFQPFEQSGSAYDSQNDINIDADTYARHQELSQLRILIDATKEDDAASWEKVREWLQSHSPEDAYEAAVKLGEYQTTSLHVACRHCPPADVVQEMMEAAPETLEFIDSFGWLPLHYACANGASVDVLRKLADAFPDSKDATDRRGRTPLHFALGNTERPASPEAVVLLSSTGANARPDENGMLPLHYACAYGASEEALTVLTDANPESVTATDVMGRTPLHFALGNADRPTSPAIVRLLLSINSSVVNSADREGGQLPLHLLSTRANSLKESQENEHKNAEKCLDLYLHAEPKATAEFLTALQGLPEWLKDHAVVTPAVQRLLNEKISHRFPTAALLIDAYCLCAMIATYSIVVLQSIEKRFAPDEDDPSLPTLKLLPLYIGCGYFLLREMVQMLSLHSLGLIRTWLYDYTNWLDVTFIFLVLYWTVLMNTGWGDDERFRTGTALSLGLLWTNVLSFLKSTYIDFAVFVNGVFHVVQRLAAFLISLVIILVAFAQMFVTLFKHTGYCSVEEETVPQVDIDVEGCEPFLDRPFCSNWFALIKVYTMLLGEVGEDDFNDSKLAMILFVIFFFLCVILLSNILIAIVTDSYGVIKNERAAIVFWSNRLDFVAEMNAISSGPWKKRLKKTFSRRQDDPESSVDKVTFGRDLWKKLIDLFEDEADDGDLVSVEFWCYTLLRMITALFIIPCWLLLGVLSAGWFWPPQVREGLLRQKIFKNNPGDVKEAEQRTAEVKSLTTQVKDLQDEVVLEMTADRKDVIEMKSQLKDIKSDIMAEMKNIKQIMTMLFDLQQLTMS